VRPHLALGHEDGQETGGRRCWCPREANVRRRQQCRRRLVEMGMGVERERKRD
jgi:hypothetical protein